MRVGIDAYLLQGGAGYRAAGVSVYTGQLLARLPRVGPEHGYVAFTFRGAPITPGATQLHPPFRHESVPARIAWEQTGLPLQASRAGLDLLHGAVNVIPHLWRRPSVVTVHDLSFLRHPDRLSRPRRLYLELAVRDSARVASRVIAVSGSTKNDLVELWGIPADRIVVVYLGVADIFRPLPDRECEPPALDGRPYILHVGTLEPRKNQDVLIRAFHRLRQRLRIPHLLAIVGGRGWMYQSLFALVRDLGLEDHVRFLDYVAPTDLPLWYNCADLFAYPSAYEGFGLPVLEAMACGTPVVTSSSSSLGELAGDACLTVETGSEEALEAAMARILDDGDLRARLVAAGLQRAAQFNWDKTARETLAVYRSALEVR